MAERIISNISGVIGTSLSIGKSGGFKLSYGSSNIAGTAGNPGDLYILKNGTSFDLMFKTTGSTWQSTVQYPTITVGGDASGSGSTSITIELNNIGTAGTYNNVTINEKGLATAGTNLGYVVTSGTATNLRIPKYNGSSGTSLLPSGISIGTDNTSLSGVTSIARGSVGAVSLFADIGTGTLTIGGATSTGTFRFANTRFSSKILRLNQGGTVGAAEEIGIHIMSGTAVSGQLTVVGTSGDITIKSINGSTLTLDVNANSRLVIGAGTLGQNLGYDGTQYINRKTNLSELGDATITSPANNHALVFNGTQWVNRLTTNYKIWTGTTTVGASGAWSINFAAAGFSSPPLVFANGRGSSDTGARIFASVNNSATTGSTSAGWANTSTTIGLLLATVNQNASSGTVIDVLAVGF